MGFALAADDSLPGKCIDGVDEDPHADDGYEPIACTAEVVPQLDEADVECQQHHHDSSNAEDEEQII